MNRKLYQVLASSLTAMINCQKSGNDEWLVKHRETIESLVADHMPSGSGFDTGTKFSFDDSVPNKLVFHTSFHHMTEHGYYDGWTEHTVTVRPDLVNGYDLTVSGRDRRDIKEYIAETFSCALDIELVADRDAGCYRRAA